MREKLAITVAQQVCRDEDANCVALTPALGRDLRKIYFDLDRAQAVLRQKASEVEVGSFKRTLTTMQERVAILKIDLLEILQNTQFADE